MDYLILRQLRIAALLLLVGCVPLLAQAQEQEVSVNLRNVSLTELFSSIEKQTTYRFAYRDVVIDKKKDVTIQREKVPVTAILDDILPQKRLQYDVVSSKSIVISEKKQAGEQSSSGVKKKITGVVTDANGEPIIGVNVVEKGTTNGTVTDLDGKFSLDLPDQTTLHISYIGYIAQELPVKNKNYFSINLLEDTQTLDEVIVVGYGTMKKKDLTGSVGSVRGDNITARKTTQLSSALQGAMAGVMVTRNNSAPGASATINVRGITTIGDSNPLVIVDGVPVDGLDDVNPNDVESISVLKDAASSAIYGSRAAAGVILVTTKRAQTDQLALDYTFEYGFETPTKLPEYAHADRYMRMVNELRWNDAGNGENEYPTYTKDLVDNYYNLNREDPDKYPITNWSDMVLKSTAPRQSHALSLMAGNNTMKTKASLAYDKTDGLYADRYYERFTARINNDFKINKYLSATLDFYFKREKSHQPVVDPMNRIRVSPEIYAALWSDGRVAGGKQGENIYGQMMYGGSNDEWKNQVGGKASIDFMPLDGLKISGIVSPSYNFDKGKKFKKQIPFYSASDPNVFEGYLNDASSTSLTEARNDYYRITTQFLATYMKTFGEHDLNVMVGYENYYAFNENLGASRDKYELDSYPYLDLGPLEYRDNNGKAWENAYRSFFGRAVYSYKDKYLLQANIRHDGSSRFHSDYRWGTFPSFSAGWVISEEGFMKGLSKLSFLKLRASWGALGNERIGNYPYQSTIGFTNALFYQGTGIVSAQSAAQLKYAIQNISWEKTESFDIGVDATFFNNRLRFTGDYYYKTTKDMLLALEIPDYMGYENPDQNTGKMNTKGFEVELAWNDTYGDFRYGVAFNLSDFKSTMGDLGGTEFLGDQVKKKGSEFNEWYGYVSDGLFQTQKEVDDSPKLNNSVKPGDVKYLDISGPDGKPDGKISPDYDRQLLGGSLPRFVYGGNLSFGYKDFDLGIGFQGIGQRNVRSSERMIKPFIEEWGNMPMLIDGNYWSRYNTEEQNRKAQYPRLSTVSGSTNYTMSDFWLFNGAYFRVKNITLGYTFPKRIMEKIFVKNLRIYATASDLFSISNYPQGWDPESAADGYPITKSFIFGLSVKF